MKKDPIFKLIDLIEKEIDLFDKRPKKEKKFHPTGECYMNDVIDYIQKNYKPKRWREKLL